MEMRTQISQIGERRFRRYGYDTGSTHSLTTHLLTRRGAFSLEYAVLIVVVAAAMVGMAIYMKRALMGKWRSVGDTFGHGKQYEPP